MNNSNNVRFYLAWVCFIFVVPLFASEDLNRGDLTRTNAVVAEAQIAGDMEVYSDSDGGVYALKVRLINLSSTNDILLRVLEETKTWLIVRVSEFTNGKPIRLTKPMPNLKEYECHHVEMPLERGATIEWFIRLKDRMENPHEAADRAHAYLSALLCFDYSKEDFSRAPRRSFQRGVVSFLQPQIFITRKALEGDPTEKYEKAIAAVRLEKKK